MKFKQLPPLLWLTSGLAIAIVVGLRVVPDWLSQQRAQEAAIAQEQAQLALIKALQAEEKFLECANQAAEIPPQSSVYAEAQSLATDCQSQFQTNLLEQAKAQADKGKFKDAINLARRIPSNSPLKQSAQSLIAVWADKLLRQAIDLAETQGKTQEATALAGVIPVDLPLSQIAQQKIATWSRDWRTNSPHFNAVNQAVARKDWQTVQQAAAQIAPTTPFWQKQRNSWLNKAQTELAIAAQKQVEAEKRRQAELEAQKLTQPQCSAIRDAYLQGNPYVKQAVGTQGSPVRARCQSLGVDLPAD
jgi:hypothetical protein